MTFAWAPGPYLAVLAAALVLGWSVFERRRQRLAMHRLGVALNPDSPLMAMLASASPARFYVRRALLASALAACILASSRPQAPGQSPSDQIGIDLVVAMDYSTSMLVDDVYPDRLTASKRAIEKLLDRSPGDRVGLVVFAGAAAHFPLTHDRQAVRAMFRGLDVQDLPPGSNLAEAVRVARCLARPGRLDDPDCNGVGGRGRGGARFDDSGQTTGQTTALAAARDDGQRGRALIVFTDGEETDGDAREELALATRLGIDVYLVAVGTEDGARVPEIDPRGYRLGWKKRADGSDVKSSLDLARLGELAAIAGGPQRLFGVGGPGRPIGELAGDLDTLQRGVWRARSVRRQRDVYEWFLFPAFMLLIVEASMSARRRSVAKSRNARA